MARAAAAAIVNVSMHTTARYTPVWGMADVAGDRPALSGDEPPVAVPDEDLLRRVRARDEAALVALYDRHAALVFTVAMRVVGDRALAEEVLQDTFLRCWTGAELWQPGRGRVSGWLLRIARNRAIDLLRSRQHQARLRESTPLPEPGRAGGPAEQDESEAIVTRQAVVAALNALPPAQRRVIELAYYGGLSQTEIAQQLGEPLGTIKSRTRAAMDHLRVSLRPYFNDE
jgi:RNA polymerase sigma-70 factor (ECF subfamily)